MSILLSTLFGLDGKYHLGGIDINFTEEQEKNLNVFGDTFFSKTVDYLLRNPVIKLTTFGYSHVFIHEMGHALAAKLCGGEQLAVNVYTNTCQGDTISSHAGNHIFVAVAGPILGILWESAKLIAAIALTIFLPPPLGLPLGTFLAAGSAFWLSGELAYACSGNGDWSFLR